MIVYDIKMSMICSNCHKETNSTQGAYRALIYMTNKQP